ncbi:DUF6624 domain-containing protein [Pedobacter gandavensis]|uniref:DUF6624 domain-containing protein n=1 Tax=Pedobacter gandavensis TaxID=2679963 RepID=UPI002931564E|nr:DUF6624 domain-containing protein [Pedobacter gandavensis]
MKRSLFFMGLVIVNLNCFAQKQINIELKQKLDTILRTDQGIREFVSSTTTVGRKDTLAKFLNYPRQLLDTNAWVVMRTIDSLNLIKVEEIISKYGYPGKTLVGEPANMTVFFVVQHSGKIPVYYPIIAQAAKDKELPFRYAGMMLDRKLADEKKEQVYGTQVYRSSIKNPKTGKKELFAYVVPIKDPKNVNTRRKEAGFDSTVEENALRLGVVYKAYTLKEIEEILNR